MLKLPTTIGPFVVNSRHALPVVEKLLQDMDLRQGKAWPYDSKGIISNRRKRNKSTPYMHEMMPFIEWQANLENWPFLSQMETDSFATGEKTDAASTREVGKEKVEEAILSRSTLIPALLLSDFP